MTTCVATICDGGKAIILATDKMIGTTFSQAGTGKKILSLHQCWKAMFAGEAIEPAYPIVERAARSLKEVDHPTLNDLRTTLQAAWTAERGMAAEAQYLSRRGMTVKQLVDEGKDRLLPQDFQFLLDRLDQMEFQLDIMAAGFDENGDARILMGSGDGSGIFKDYAGFWAIGSGGQNAIMMLNYRRVTPEMSVREAMYYTIEAKYYGELAPGVSEDTDLIVLRHGKDDISIAEKTVEDILFQKIAIPNSPRPLTPAQKMMINRIKELQGIVKIKVAKSRRREKKPQQ